MMDSHMNARYYDPTTGRFLSKDPLGLQGGDLTLYSYAGNNPVAFVDPSGLCASNSGVSKDGFIETISKAWDAHQQFHGDIRNNAASLSESSWGVYLGTVAGAVTGVGLIVVDGETIWVGVDILLGITKGPTKKK